MRTDRLRINQLPSPVYEWYLDYLQVMDTKDIQLYSTFLADDCAMQFNNEASIQGKDSIVQFLSDYWETFDTIEHDLLNIYGTDSSFVLEALNYYKQHDGAEVTLKAAAFTDRNDQGLVTSVRLYTDTTPLSS